METQRTRAYEVCDAVCAAVQGDLELVNRILDSPRSSTWFSTVVKYAAKMGHMHILEQIPLSRCWPNTNGLEDIGEVRGIVNSAALDGRIEVLNWIAAQISVVRLIKITNGYPLAKAAKNNQTETLNWFNAHLRAEILSRGGAEMRVNGFEVESSIMWFNTIPLGATIRLKNGVPYVFRHAMQLAFPDMVRNNSVEALAWLKNQGATFDDAITVNGFANMLRCFELGAQHSPVILRQLIQHFSEELEKHAFYLGGKTLGETLIAKAIECGNCMSLRIIAESKTVARKRWVSALGGAPISALEYAFDWLQKEDYAALQRLDIWKKCAAKCVANAIVAQRGGAADARGLPNELWLHIMSLF
jgi:hypothetical protein